MTQPLIPPGILAPSQAQPTVNYGTDFDVTNDWNPAKVLITGRHLLSQALYRRYITPRGRLIYDANYGTDLRQYVNAGIRTADFPRIQAAVVAEALKDDRVVNCTCSSSFTAGVLNLAIIVTDGLGPFPLTLGVNSVTVTILSPPP